MPLRRHAFLWLAAVVLAGAARGQEVRIYVTSQAGDRIAAKPPLHFDAARGASGFTIDEKVRDQEIIGFGASFLESGAICLNSLDAGAQERFLKRFSTRERAPATPL